MKASIGGLVLGWRKKSDYRTDEREDEFRVWWDKEIAPRFYPLSILPHDDFLAPRMDLQIEFKSKNLTRQGIAMSRQYPGWVLVNEYSVLRHLNYPCAGCGRGHSRTLLVERFLDAGYYCRVLDKSLMGYPTVDTLEFATDTKASGQRAILVPLGEFRPLKEWMIATYGPSI